VSWLLALGIVLDLLVLTENPWILYPLALISAFGVIVILTLVYTMVWVMLLRRENRFVSLAQLVLPLLGGFIVALMQIAFIDFARYHLMGTWAGFPIG
jgi:hypothetical protein